MKGMQVCVTGATGFIGQCLVDALFHQGYSVRVLTRHSGCPFPDDVQVVVGDLTLPECPLDQFLIGCEVLFHCAGEIGDVTAMHLLHVDGTQRLLDAVLKETAQTGQKIHWVQLSSIGVYGPPLDSASVDRIVTEDSPLRPAGEYETTKAKADELVAQASKAGALTYSILRPSNVFGAGMTNQSLRALIQMVKRRLFFYVGKPGAVATYVHVDDTVSALMKCAVEPRAIGRVYNLSNDCLLEDLIKSIALIAGVQSPWIRIPEPVIRISVSLLDNWIDIPLTQSRIDALVSRTQYPADRIVSELGFSFSAPVPYSIKNFVRKGY